jgi:hypothetical protein
MNRTVQFIIGVIAVVVALGAGLFGRNLYLKEVSTYQVPVPINAIPAYAILDADMFQMREMPRTMASLPYYQSTQLELERGQSSSFLTNFLLSLFYRFANKMYVFCC